MKVRPLLIGVTEQAAIDAVKAKARKRPIPLEAVVRAGSSTPTPMLDLKDRKPGYKRTQASLRVELPVGYDVAVSYEDQPAGVCLHISVSVDSAAKGYMPHPAAIEMIMDAFGIERDKLLPINGRIWVEEFAPGERAVNVISVVEPRTGTVQ